jgi:adenylate kinase
VTQKIVVALTGLSGVGKSTLIKALAAMVPLEHLQASALIREGQQASGDAALTQDQLRLVDIDENQQLLVSGFQLMAGKSKGLIIVDGHTVIERDGGLTRIDARVFGALGIHSMIFLVDDPDAIATRRRNDTVRKRPLPSIDRLQLIQNQALEHADAICRTLAIPLYVYRPDEVALIARTLEQQDPSRE